MQQSPFCRIQFDNFNHLLKNIKMRASIIISVLLFLSNLSTAQRKPEFEFTLYGEDAKGHKDSVVIAYDKDAYSRDTLDERFGDISIATLKMDSVFEMRVHKTQYSEVIFGQVVKKGNIAKHITLKYLILDKSSNCVTTGGSQFGFVIVKIKYPPLKFYWNKDKFDYRQFPCVAKSYMIDNQLRIQESYPENVKETKYLFKENSIIDSINTNGFVGPYKYPDGTVDSIRVNYLIQFLNYGIRGTKTDELESIAVKSYPNPCKETLNVNLPESLEQVRVNIYSIDGALMQATHSVSSTIVSIDTGPLSIGNHVLEIIGRNGKRYVGKFVKM
jgi:hypothetical protein